MNFITLILEGGELLYLRPEAIHGFNEIEGKVAVYFTPGHASQTDMTLPEFLDELARPRSPSTLRMELTQP